MKSDPFDARKKGFRCLIALALTAAMVLPGWAADSWADEDGSLQRFLELAQRAAPLIAEGPSTLDQAVAVLGGEIKNRGGNGERGGSRWVSPEIAFYAAASRGAGNE